MTKERRLAIQMWEKIAAVLEAGAHNPRDFLPIISAIKADFCRAHNLNWQHDCWFCQYVRQDYRSKLTSREFIKLYRNGCEKCPLYKEHKDILGYDECGCTDLKETLWRQVIEGNAYAARRIVELLRNGK